ncbi:Leucine-rich repeat and coiled-coil domain-containing protein 1 [Schistosoma japonicum]|nr:Leucine-rich repeat and coiled-coil domain-containing protein 1 [Schistosoma japonicum]
MGMGTETVLELINSGIENIDSLSLSPKITVLNLHHNLISKINGLTNATVLRYLDLSSNYISKICGLDSLHNLRILNLSSNKIQTIDSLDKLNCLVRLDISFNEITNLDGLKKLFGPNYSLTAIILHGNQIKSKPHLLECLKNLVNLRQLILFSPHTGDSNPVCNDPDYRMDLLQGLPQLEILDHTDRMGRPIQVDILADLPESQLNSLIISHLMKFYETECDHSKHHSNLHQSLIDESNQNRSNFIPMNNEIHMSKVNNTLENVRIDLCQHIPEKEVLDGELHNEANIQPNNLTLQSANNREICSTHPSQQLSTHSHPNLIPNNPSNKTKRSIVDKKPSNAITKPKSISGRLSHKTSNEKKAKEEISRRSTSVKLVNLNCETIGHDEQVQDVSTSTEFISSLMTKQNDPGKEDITLSKILKELDQEKVLRKQSEQMCQDLVNRIRELELAVIDQHEAIKVTEELKHAFTTEHQEKLLVHSQLKLIEEKYKEMCQIADNLHVKEDADKSRYEQEIENLNKQLCEIRTDYNNVLSRAEKLEQKLNKTKMLLHNREIIYEQELNSRYKLDSPEVTKLISAKIDLVQIRYQKDIDLLQEKLVESSKRYSALEDEFRMALRIEAERYETLQLKEMIEREESSRCLIQELNSERIVTLEAHLEEAQTRIRNHENLRKELKQQKAELTARESLIAGLRAERLNWSEELAKQGSALAQDRGRLEAKTEAQELEITSLKKSLEHESDSVKIKNKVIDDQTETILSLKKFRNSMSNRWRDRACLIDKLEKQVEQMRHNWDEEQKRLVDERDTARKEISTLQSQIETMNEGFRQQLLAIEEMKDLAVNNLRNEAEQLRIACETRVESEMRIVLLEAENSRKATQERLRSISAALCTPILPDTKIQCFNN